MTRQWLVQLNCSTRRSPLNAENIFEINDLYMNPKLKFILVRARLLAFDSTGQL